MHPKFLDILCCPETESGLSLEADEVSPAGSVRRGTLTSHAGGRRYPIIGGVPRFVGKEVYAQSFGYEWRKWSRVQFEGENVGRTMAGYTEKMFDAVTGFTAPLLEGKLVVEFGCGPGRFLDVVRRRGGIAVGIDMSAAVEPARENFGDDPDVLIVQGDILRPPFKKGAFDLGYSIGVLHHTPNPAKGLKELSSLVKEHGAVVCCVYPKDGLYDLPSVAAYRKIHNAVKPVFGNHLALGYSYFAAYVLYHGISLVRRTGRAARLLSYLERNVFVNLDIPDARWRLLDTFDAITPVYASTHTPEEVRAWFAEADCHSVSQRPWATATFAGIKGEER